jgi:5-dehydro-4-deoxyglucarate dehydratase
MSRRQFSNEHLRRSLSGLLSFPLTPFGQDSSIDCRALAGLIDIALTAGATGFFVACGTGEFNALTRQEFQLVVTTAVRKVRGRVPVFAGAGGGTAVAIEFVQIAAEAGADGVLVLPPYLVEAPSDGLAAHYLAIAAATDLRVVVYQRANAVFEPVTVERLVKAENIIGFKDGVGQIERLHRIRATVGDRLIYMNGMPTAELYAGALAACGARGYSSALLNFVPEIASEFYSAFCANDAVTMNSTLDRAVLPFVEIRNRRAGYAVSLVKAGARLRGLAVGSVRPPLADPTAPDEADMKKLLQRLGLDHNLIRAAAA